MVQSGTMEMVSEVTSGLTPGPLHNILRAETFALLQVLRLCCEADIYIDNSAVVLYANDILRNGFRPAHWESKADGDLWTLTASELVSRPPNARHVFKVKAHVAFEEASDSFRRWLVTGNAASDKLAKRPLASYVEDNNLQNRTTQESTQIDDAFRCAQKLHQLSLRIRDVVKKKPDCSHMPPLSSGAGEPREEKVEVKPWPFHQAQTFNSSTWDEKWLLLVQHYFALLQWPSVDQRLPVPISLVEIMLDLCLTFQVRVPVNLMTTQLKGPGVPVLPPKSPAKYFLPTRQMGAVLPPECLKQSSHTFLRTFDSLQKMLAMAPVDRENLRSLARIGYSNVLPSLRISPVLLSGLQARSLLTRILTPGVRVLKYSYRLPVVLFGTCLPFLPISRILNLPFRQCPSESHT